MNNISKMRKFANLTQCELAREIGVAQSAVAAWETGKANPQYSKLEKIAKALKCSVKDLV